jgi:hypothetical protein
MHRERITLRGLLVLLFALAALMAGLSYYTKLNA